MGCHLVILGCNTASAKALRSIQQCDLPQVDPSRRVLGVIRPTAETVGQLTRSRHVGVLATEGTIRSESYNMEIGKLHQKLTNAVKDGQSAVARIEHADRACVVWKIHNCTLFFCLGL